jgi:predicted RNase H-like HicB family nuclease
MRRYAVVIEKAVGNYSAYCPDLPGCIATGLTVEETVARMKEAIEFHLDGLKRDSALTPEPAALVEFVEV